MCYQASQWGQDFLDYSILNSNQEGTVFAGVVLDGSILTMQLDLVAVEFTVSLPLVCTIANIMLSNNICDLRRILQTTVILVYYIGRNKL